MKGLSGKFSYGQNELCFRRRRLCLFVRVTDESFDDDGMADLSEFQGRPTSTTISDSYTMVLRQSGATLLRTLHQRPLALTPNAIRKSFSPLLPQIRLLSEQTRSAIDKAVSSAPVVLFMKGTPEFPQCGFSRASIQVLGMQGLDPAKFAAFNVLEDQELRAGIKEYSDWPTIPQLYVDKEFVGGCDILMKMHSDGELAKLLEDKGVLVPVEGEEASKSS